MMKYFRSMQNDNSDFFYTIEVDEMNRLKNVFWADARSREAYKEFGDVVSFDTTYLVNKYDMPFAPFVGVNHHGQSILFGCGLVTREDTSSFVWLFKAWLECMFGIHPHAIITDQCKAMKKAISQVFPNTRHRWCLWHIMKKIPDKLKGYKHYKAIKFNLKVAVYDSLSSNDFEKAWEQVMKEYNLHDNEWLGGLYEERNRWVPAMVKDTFWAGMSTTQRSESINSFFDGYVKSSTSLKVFVEQYENALGKKVQNEEAEDLRCINFQVKRISPFKFEEQFKSAYTLEKFKQFGVEMGEQIGCNLTAGPVVDGVSEFYIKHDMVVGNKHPIEKQFTYTTLFDEKTCETNCNCRMFESKGMVCAHMIKVWAQKMLEKVPEKYILKRWKKNLVRTHTKVKISYANWKKKPEWHRFDKMQNIYHEAADKAMYSDAKAAIVVAKITEAIEIIENFDEKEYTGNVPTFGEKIVCCETIVGDPAKGSRRGRPPKSRMESETEKYAKKMSNKISNNDQPLCIDILNDTMECYRPIFTQESTNICQSQMDESVNDTTEFDAELLSWH